MEAFKMSFLDDWKEWSTTKKAISIIAVCCVGILIIAALGGALSSDKNTSTKTAKNTTDNQVKGVQVKVSYDGEWQGAAGAEGSTNSISGTGDKTIDMDKDAHIVSVNAQKMDGSSSTLTVQILKDGKVVKESSTDTQYGVASVSATV